MTNEERLEALYPKTQAEAEELIQLGMVLKHAMNEVDRKDRFTGLSRVLGKRFENAFKTHFPMPDGREWEITVQRRVP